MGNYPIQFRDEIDEYLFKEFGILAGCCSSIKSFEYSVARQVAEKLWNKQKNSTDSLIDNACKWLKENAYFYVNDYTGGLNDDMLVNEFHKAMKE